jgi:hypothetical protein
MAEGTSTPPSRRVLLGMGAPDDIRLTIAAAAEFAAAVRSELLCLLVEQEDLINAAGLPFARAYGFGGLAAPFTLQAVQERFDSLAREAGKALAECCGRANVAWQMLRPQGEIMRELAGAVQQGDILVVDARELRQSALGFIGALRLLLDKADAVVLPSPVAQPQGPVVAVGGEHSVTIAASIAGALGRRLETVDLAELQRARRRISVVVAPLAAVAALGEDEWLRRMRELQTTAVLVGA